ncbi:hypothetical protein LINPERHAP2_LOCUS19266 [Linum perenne]
MELVSISCILFFKLCLLASIFVQLVSMDIRDNFLVAERGWMACILLDSICSLHCKKHPNFSSRVIFLFVESLTVLYPRETASASSRYEVGAHHNTVGSRGAFKRKDTCKNKDDQRWSFRPPIQDEWILSRSSCVSSDSTKSEAVPD